MVQPLPDKYGSELISVSVKDAAGLFPDFPHSIIVTILPRNDQPRLTRVNDTNITTDSLPLTIYEDQWSTFVFSAEDIDQDPLSYSTNITEVLPELRKNEDYTFSKVNGTLEIRPRNFQVGIYKFLISIDDGNSGMDSLELNLTIVNTNDAPFIPEIFTKYVEQGEWLEIVPYAYDEDEVHGDTLTFSTNFSEYLPATQLSSKFFFNSTSGEFRFKPDKDTVATYDTYIEVSDRSMVKYRRNFKIKVTNINDPPEAPVFNHSYEEGNLSVTFTALPVRDPDGDNLTYTWDFGDGSQNLFGQNLLTVAHTYRKAGNFTVILWVSDGNPDGINRTIMNITVTTPGGGMGPGNEIDGLFYEFSCWVKDHKGTELGNALIRIEDIDDPVNYFENFTDSVGKNRFKRPAGNYTVTITLQGFDTWTDELIVKTNDIQKDIILKKDVANINTGSEMDMGKTVSGWVWVLLGILVLLVLFGIIMIILIKKKSRPEKREELLIETTNSQDSYPPAEDMGVGAPQDMTIQPLAPLELVQYSPDDPAAPLMIDEYPYTQEEWPAPAEGKIPEKPQLPVEGKIPEKLMGAETPQLLIEGKKPEEQEIPELQQLPAESKHVELLDELLDEEAHEDVDSQISMEGLSQPETMVQITEAQAEESRGITNVTVDEKETALDTMVPIPGTSATSPKSLEESDSSHSATPLQKEEPTSIQAILMSIIKRDDLLKQYGIKPKPPKPSDDEEESSEDESVADVLSVFDGLLDEHPAEKENDNKLGIIPVERVAISRIDGAEMNICNSCKQPFNASEPECPSCSQRIGITLRCPVCASEVIKEMVFCNKCGTNLRNLKAFKSD